jgi:hypothetical protein
MRNLLVNFNIYIIVLRLNISRGRFVNNRSWGRRRVVDDRSGCRSVHKRGWFVYKRSRCRSVNHWSWCRPVNDWCWWRRRGRWERCRCRGRRRWEFSRRRWRRSFSSRGWGWGSWGSFCICTSATSKSLDEASSLCFLEISPTEDSYTVTGLAELEEDRQVAVSQSC